MKRNSIIAVCVTIVILAVVALILVIKKDPPGVALNPNELYAKIKEQVSLPEDMTSRNSTDLDIRYGIDTNNATDYVFMANSTSYFVDTIAIFKVENTEHKKDIAEKLTTIKTQAMNSMNNYDAEQYKIASDGKVEISGNYVFLVMSKDTQKVLDIIKNNI